MEDRGWRPTLSRLYLRTLPRPLQRRLSPGLDAADLWLSRTVAIARDLSPTRLTGVISDDGLEAPAATLLLGSSSEFRWLLDRIAPKGSATTSAHRRSIGDILRRPRQRPAAILVAADRVFTRPLTALGFIAIPSYVDFSFDCDVTPEQLWRTGSNSIRDNLRKIRRASYQHEETREVARLRQFYDELYLPYITRRYAGQAQITSFENMSRLVENGVLLLLRQGGEVVAGGLIIRPLWQPPLVAFLGARCGEPDAVRAGALVAFYLRAQAWAREQGHRHLDFGTAAPFLTDGVLRHKRTWGMRVARSRRRFRSLFLWLSPTPPPQLVEFLRSNPIIHERRGRLAGLMFLDRCRSARPGEVDADEIDAHQARYRVPGLAGFDVRVLSNPNRPEPDSCAH